MIRIFLIAVFSYCSLTSFSQHDVTAEFNILPHPLLPHTPVKNQNISSTCWSFASNSFIESELMRKGMKEVDLSEMFVARLSYIRKIKTHLRLKGNNYFTPGGQFHDVQWVIKNYGLITEEAYPGRPAGELYHDHRDLDTLIKHRVARMLKAGKSEPDSADLKFINQVLDEHLGKLPANFLFQAKAYTTEQFARQKLGLDPNEYIEITSYSHHPWYKSFQLENKYNWSGNEYLNVPLEDLIRITDYALNKGYTVLWNGDVTDRGFRFESGFAELENFSGDLSKERQRSFEDSSSYLDHVMHIIGLSMDNKSRRWYFVKNSWGNDGNRAGGFLYMDAAYFAVKTAAIVVNKEAIPEDIRKKSGL